MEGFSLPHLLFYEAGTAPTTRSVRELTSLARHGWDITVAHQANAAEDVAALGLASLVLPDPPGNPLYNQLSTAGAALSEQSARIAERIATIADQLRTGESAKLRLRLAQARQRVDDLAVRVNNLRAATKARAEASARKDLAVATKERGALGERIRSVEGGLRAELAELKQQRLALAAQVRAVNVARRVTTPITGGATFGDLGRWEARWHAHAPRLATVDADVFWAADLDALPAVIWAAEASGHQPPVVYDSHELFCELEYMPELYRAAWRQLANTFIPKASAVITVCEPIARVLDAEYGANGTHVLHNLAAAAPSGLPGLRAAIELPAEVPLAIHVGNISHARNPQFAVDLLTDLPQLHVAFIGAPNGGIVGEIRAWATERSVSNRLHFVPPVPLTALTGFIADADVSLILLDGNRSRDTLYTMPNKMFDSLSAGVPVVAPNACSAGDFVTDEGVGRTFSLNAPGELAAAVRSVLDDSTLRQRVVAQAARYTWTQAEPALFALVDDLVRERET
jgi:glycosyltransferase involved in cell wall biosynthesis